MFEKEITALKEQGVIDNEKIPVVYNANFGHATPRCALQYGVAVKVDMLQKKIFPSR